MNRAYATLEIKSVDKEKRIIEGIASSPSVDRMGDIVEPEGMEATFPVPFLYQHDSALPIGHVLTAKQSKKEIKVTVQLASIDEPGALKDRLDMAWQSIKSGLIRGLSIGFRSIESARIDGTYGMRFTKWELLELSAVTVPANQDATITAIKSIDKELLAASGRAQNPVVKLGKLPGVSGVKSTIKPEKDKHMTIRDQIKQFEATRAAKAARMTELMEAASTAGTTLDADQADEYDGLEAEIKQIDGHLRRLNDFEQTSIAKATSVNADKINTTEGAEHKAASTRSGLVIRTTQDLDEKFKGQNFTRMVIARALSRSDENHRQPSVIAEKRWGKTNPTLISLMKANEVAGGGSGSGEWGAELVSADNRYTGDFIEYLNSKTVFNQLPLRPIPPNVTIKGQDGKSTGYWVGESKPIKVTTGDFSTVSLTPMKVAALAVVSNELLRDSSPSAEALVRDALVEASAQRIDETFLSDDALSAGVSPAGLRRSLAALHSAGNDVDSVRADIAALYAPFITAKNATGLYFVMNPSLAKALQLMANALGQEAFPGVTAQGGTLFGDPVVVGDNVNAAHLYLLKPSDIWSIGDLGIEVSISREAMIEQSSAPSGATDTPVAAASTPVSMFQEESTAIKVVRPMNFQKRRSTAVAWIDDAAYGQAAT